MRQIRQQGRWIAPPTPSSNVFKTISHIRKTGKDLIHMNTHLRKLQTVLVSVSAEVIGRACHEHAPVR